MFEITTNNRFFFLRVITAKSSKTNYSENEVITFYAFDLSKVWSYCLASLLAMRDLLKNSRDNAGVISYYQIKGKYTAAILSCGLNQNVYLNLSFSSESIKAS